MDPTVTVCFRFTSIVESDEWGNKVTELQRLMCWELCQLSRKPITCYAALLTTAPQWFRLHVQVINKERNRMEDFGLPKNLHYHYLLCMSWSIQHVKPNYQITSGFTLLVWNMKMFSPLLCTSYTPEDLFIAASRMTFLGTKQKKQNIVLLQKKAKDGFVRESFDCRRVDLKKKKKLT